MHVSPQHYLLGNRRICLKLTIAARLIKQRGGGGLLLICNVIKIPEYMSYGRETYLSKMESMKKLF
jgi:hypothetical protein